MKLLCILMLAISLQAYASHNKQEVIYMDSSANEWKEAKLRQCEFEVSVMVLSVFEARIGTPHALTKEDPQELHKKLMTSCVQFYRLSI